MREVDAPERVDHGLRLLTPPNALSMVRALAVIPVIWLLQHPDPGSRTAAVVVLVIAGLTDLADGALARARGWVSPSGKIVDPVADKILIGGLVVYLTIVRGFPLWLVVLIVARDIALVLGATLFLKRDRLVFAANRAGKLTTFSISMLILAYVLEWEAAYVPLTVIAVLLVLVSTVSYGLRAVTHRRTPDRLEEPRGSAG